MQYSFVFDTNKCVGCHACAVACAIENGAKSTRNWRVVSTFNSVKHPDLPLFHFSLACNHCETAPCIDACPASVYSHDAKTGAVILNHKACIGCTYCTWACPYDAPKFNASLGVIEKCNFCNGNLKDGRPPACVNLCPTGALGFEDKFSGVDNSKVFGFIEKGIKPSIRIIELRQKEELPLEVLQSLPNYPVEESDFNIKEEPKKITLNKDWSLVLFTLLASVLVGTFTAAYLVELSLNLYIFSGAGVLGIILSSMHLGKKFRAWRAVVNVKTSWLSREIFFFSLFWFASAAWIYLQEDYLGFAALLSGILALISIDMVYSVTEKTTPNRMHSAHVTLTGLFIAGLIIENNYLWLIPGAIKAALFLYRKWYYRKTISSANLLISGIRLDFLITIPAIVWYFEFEYSLYYIFVSVLLGEIIDRADYYSELEIITPGKKLKTKS